MKKYISIIVITVLCFVKINAQVIVPDNLSLFGTQTGDSIYKAVNIQSTQVINSGKTTYTASNEIVLNPGFEVKTGAEFEIIMDDDSLNNLTMMTYNIWIKSNKFSEHAQVITQSNADVVSIQEIKGKTNFDNLKDDTGYEGEMCKTVIKGFFKQYGIALLWKSSLDTPTITKRVIDTPKDPHDKKRAYITAEFTDFCFIATHYSTSAKERINMTNTILNENIVMNCKNAGKPIYIAGDMNEDTNGDAIQIFTSSSNGFEVLNDPTHATYFNTETGVGYFGDFILEYNTNPKHKTIERGIPNSFPPEWYRVVSDHFPYVVKVKLK
jgi:endonuclease/exonuclease/phosphatase family metal-dependent hydrolase